MMGCVVLVVVPAGQGWQLAVALSEVPPGENVPALHFWHVGPP